MEASLNRHNGLGTGHLGLNLNFQSSLFLEIMGYDWKFQPNQLNTWLRVPTVAQWVKNPKNYFQEMLLVCAEISNLPWTVAIGLHIISLALPSIAVPHLVMLLFSQGHWLLGLALLIFTRHWHRFFNILEMPNLLREEGRDWRWKDRRGNFSPWFCFMVKRLLMPWCVTEPSNFWRFYS